MRKFIDEMREQGLVDEIERPVSTRFEAAQMAVKTDRVLYFHDCDGKEAVMNLTADRRALAAALGADEKGLIRRLAAANYDGNLKPMGKLEMRPADFSELPVMTFYPKDGGPYITAGIVFSRLDGVENASIHRMMVTGKDRVAARLVEGRHTYVMHREALARGERLPIAMVIGAHPAVTFASCTRVPEGRELQFAAELLGGELPVWECPNGVLVPEAEIVLEGYIGNETAEEGPFVDITGTYDFERIQPVIEFTGMWTKENPVYHSILPGGSEHRLLMGVPYEPKIYRAVAGVTTVRNVVLTTGGCGYLHGIVQVRKNTQGDGKNAIMAAFAAHTSLKHVVVVDEDIDPFDPEDVEYAIATRVRGDRDLMVVTGVRGSSLDPCREGDGTNVKIGVDATMTLGEEEKFVRAGWDE
ncbi:UbiD family decarboxylase [Methanofollis formosanus]|uniref:Anhydromevalonate phosphate decarboxylase n=1 Tax=Methanofollis formosanus TaxID=299308 RepID=A0A8G1EH33_9EURY|nr:UbiD family decarboxylase [Methanofollis formosanus]QYZ80415.1 UbiD family decarboxylase [Methanofollis formosanus]